MSESKQDIVVRMVQERKWTRDQIREAAGCTSGALASYLTSMKNAAKYTGQPLCPITDENGIFSVTTYEEAEKEREAKAAERTAAAKKTPEERLEAAHKRVTRAGSVLDKAQERYDNNSDNRELELRLQKAKIEADLADIELDKAKKAVAESPDSSDDMSEEVEEEEFDDTEEGEDELM